MLRAACVRAAAGTALAAVAASRGSSVRPDDSSPSARARRSMRRRWSGPSPTRAGGCGSWPPSTRTSRGRACGRVPASSGGAGSRGPVLPDDRTDGRDRDRAAPRLGSRARRVGPGAGAERAARAGFVCRGCPGKPAVFGALEPVLAAFEASHASVENLELVLEDPASGPRAELIGAMFSADRTVDGEWDDVRVLAAPTPEAELRLVAARIRRLVDAGTPPEQIAVCGARRRRMGLAASCSPRTGLSLEERRDDSLAEAGPARLALALLGLPRRGFAREDVLAVLASSYLESGDLTAADRGPRAHARAAQAPRRRPRPAGGRCGRGACGRSNP